MTHDHLCHACGRWTRCPTDSRRDDLGRLVCDNYEGVRDAGQRWLCEECCDERAESDEGGEG